MLSLLVTIKIKPGYRDAFVESLMGDARGSVNDEPGCLRFDALQDTADPNCILLYEV
jgi:(4S)-4-hydroxy-5-phosphonooxypentane-2,3-dione isomerase